MEWSESYSVTIKEIDDQHKKFFDIINRLYDSFMDKRQDDEVRNILSEMKLYASMHFGFEESYFKDVSYPEKREHLAQHEFFLMHVDLFYTESLVNIKALTPKVMFFLRDWLKDHILGSDQKYIPYLKKLG